MTIRPIIILPDPLLRKVSEPVERFDAELRKFADDMLETMYDAPGVGLAAIQLGIARRIVVLDVSHKEESIEKQPLVVINPRVLSVSDECSICEEGCLSIPEYYAEVERPAEVCVRYTDLDGKEQEIQADGLLATCMQHELDHLDGVLFIDYITRLKRDRVIKKFTKAAKLQKL